MPLRVIEIVTPREDKEEVIKSLEEHRPDEGYVFWASPLDDDSALSFRVILDVQESENVLDKLENLFSWNEKYRIIVFAAEATIPRLKIPEKEEPEVTQNDKNAEVTIKNRISREELYSDVLDTSVMSKSYVMLVIFSALVAVIGLMRGNVAIIIGAMVLAPLLGPNVGFSLATTLGDKKLALESSKTLAVGVALAFLVSLGAGLLLGLPKISSELLLRSTTSFSDIILAIVSGAAGIISFTLGVPTSLVGVMVALSILPPLSACGIFLGAGETGHAAGAGLLFLTNIICLNLAGVVTFLLQGIQPLTWWDRERAKVTAIRMAFLWGIMLAILILFLYFGIIS
ncbi:TIGR00341 family protein [Desulfovibrio gilichinskyi]|uniref:TIGR00341 family protein n=1 Tax=Desulfovibrio gilichinskyi TaxID=1519643 RepID=A0A1X7CVA8_9BACT|nr:TIGR00341 family protein [Desulfovibrio gilichinskyi]SMF03468.1 TIGR00341 family protein [Desulfovibrio gilichinskyi]